MEEGREIPAFFAWFLPTPKSPALGFVSNPKPTQPTPPTLIINHHQRLFTRIAVIMALKQRTESEFL
jgi:hypothetical protein